MATKEEKELIRKVAVTYGKKGGKKTLAVHGVDHFKTAGKRGAISRWGNKKALKKK